MSASRLVVFAFACLAGIIVAGELSKVLILPWQALVALGLWAGLAARKRSAVWALAVLMFCAGAARFSHEEGAARAAQAAVRAAAASGEHRVVEGTVRSVERRHPDRLALVLRERETDADLRFTVVFGDDSGPSILPGDRVEARGRVRPAARYRLPGTAPRARRFAGSLSAEAGDVEVVSKGARADPRRLAARAQSRLVAWISARGGPEEGRAVVRAALTGDRGGMPESAAGALRDAGAAHVLAVSGLHLAAVAGMTFLVARRLAAAIPGLAIRIRPARAAALCAAPVAILYTLVTGAQTSTVRALVMALVALFGAASDRRPRGPEALALAALAIALSSPHAVFEPAFQLSFSAAAALVFGGTSPAAPRAGLARAAGAIRSLTRASVLTAAATAPFTALHFGYVAVAGVVTNLVAVPLTSSAVLPLGLVGAGLSMLWPAAGAAVVGVAIWIADRVVAISAAVAGVLEPWPLPPPAPHELAALAVAAGALWAGARGHVRLRGAAGGCAMALAACALPGLATAFAGQGEGELRVTFLEVGHGDASVLELPNGEVWLVDAGGQLVWSGDDEPSARRRLAAIPGERAVLEYLRHRRIDEIDRVIVSHAHADHYAGLFAIAGQVRVDELWIARPHAGRSYPKSYRALVAALALGGTRIVYPRLDVPYRSGDVKARVFAPRFSGDVATEDPVLSANDNSLVVRVDYGGRRVLFAGDVEREAEALIADAHAAELRADLVQVPHHGSDTSSTPPLVDAVSPAWAVISCGVGNSYGMPAADVVGRWRHVGARVVTTADVGSVTAIIDESGTIRVAVADPGARAQSQPRSGPPGRL